MGACGAESGPLPFAKEASNPGADKAAAVQAEFLRKSRRFILVRHRKGKQPNGYKIGSDVDHKQEAISPRALMAGRRVGIS
jgi:hypothetical protein